jgi:hypothetical protein
VVNGILAPPLVILVVLLTNNKKVMRGRVNSSVAKVLGWICAVVIERGGPSPRGYLSISVKNRKECR